MRRQVDRRNGRDAESCVVMVGGTFIGVCVTRGANGDILPVHGLVFERGVDITRKHGCLLLRGLIALPHVT